MQFAYLILAHRYPWQLKRLVNKLTAWNTSFFIHLDSRVSNWEDFVNLFSGMVNVHFVRKRVVVYWGGFSIVTATLNGLREIEGTGLNYDYVTILSGQDYPIKSNQYIADYFEANKGSEFIHYKQFPSLDLEQGGMDRIYYYYDFENPFSAYGLRNANVYEYEMRKRCRARKGIPGMTLYNGSQWWSLTLDCIRHILNTVNTNPDLVNFYKYSKFPDEQFFQTIVMNSPFSGNVHNDSLWYTDWSGNTGNNGEATSIPHPKTLDASDFPKLSSSSKLFARKFDMNVNREIMDLIDLNITK